MTKKLLPFILSYRKKFYVYSNTNFFLTTQPSSECQKDTGNICVPFIHKGEVYNDCVPPTSDWFGSPWCLVANQTGSYTDYSTCAPCEEDKYVLHDTTNYKHQDDDEDEPPTISEGLNNEKKLKLSCWSRRFIYLT